MKRCLFALVAAGTVLGLAARAGAQAGPTRPGDLTPEVERAIERGLRYLAARQNADGSWGNKYQCGMTALALMSFMLKGYFPERGLYGERLDKAVAFLLARAKQGGGFLGGNMYEHGLATLALSEVWGMSDREEVRDTLKRAVDVILRAQSPRGGWRYHPRPIDADISATVMQIVALASAKEAGIHVPSHVIRRAQAYVKWLQEGATGGFGYTSPGRPGFARTAAGVLSLFMTGERNSRPVLAGLSYLRRYPAEKFGNVNHYYYGHYYAVQAMYQAGETYYQEWYPHIRDALLAKQREDGGWSAGHDEAYGTGMAILTLGVPYRYLPIYQR